MRVLVLALSFGLLASCASPDPYVAYRASMPPPLPAPSAAALATARSQRETLSEQTTRSIVFTARPTTTDLIAAYPSVAMNKGIGGVATLECIVQADGALACAVGSEEPVGQGFGEAGRLMAAKYRAAPKLPDGTDAAGSFYQLTINFTVQ